MTLTQFPENGFFVENSRIRELAQTPILKFSLGNLSAMEHAYSSKIHL